MAEWEVREGSTNLFRAKEKKSDKSPDFSSQVLVDGKLKDLALWERRDRNGNVYYGAKISEGRERTNAKPEGGNVVPLASAPKSAPLDDDIPF